MNLPGFHTKNKGVNSIMYFCRTNYQKGRPEHFWSISCEKSLFYAKKIIFFPILGGGTCAGCAPPWIRPCEGHVFRFP
jgi:hypothetical protein